MAQQEKNEEVRQIVTGERKEPSSVKRFKDVFIADTAGGIGDMLVWDVFVPAIKNMLSQGWHSIGDSLFGTGTRYRGSYGASYGGSRSSYGEQRSYARRTDRDYPRESSRYDDRRRSRDCEWVLHSWGDADQVQADLQNLIMKYPRGVSISQLNSLVGVSDRDYKDSDWGWRDISRSQIHLARNYFPDGSDGYILEMPQPIYIND